MVTPALFEKRKYCFLSVSSHSEQPGLQTIPLHLSRPLPWQESEKGQSGSGRVMCLRNRGVKTAGVNID